MIMMMTMMMNNGFAISRSNDYNKYDSLAVENHFINTVYQDVAFQ